LTDSAIADGLIALGITVEVVLGTMRNNHIQTELRKRSNDKLIDAVDRASRTEVEFIKLKTPRRKLFAGKESTFAIALSAFSGTLFDIGMGPNDGEVEDFIWDIEPALAAAGWKQIAWAFPGLGGAFIFVQRGGIGASRPLLGSVAAMNVMVTFNPGAPAALQSAAEALVSALNGAEIEAHVVGFNVHNINGNAIHILIGPKR
jgi:hypothetical protein